MVNHLTSNNGIWVKLNPGHFEPNRFGQKLNRKLSEQIPHQRCRMRWRGALKFPQCKLTGDNQFDVVVVVVVAVVVVLLIP